MTFLYIKYNFSSVADVFVKMSFNFVLLQKGNWGTAFLYNFL